MGPARSIWFMRPGAASQADGWFSWLHMARHQRHLRIAAGLAVGRAMLDLLRPWPVALAVNHAIDGRPLGEPWGALLGPVAGSPAGVAAVAGLALIGLTAASSVVGFLSEYLTAADAERVSGALRAELHRRLLQLPAGFHDRQRSDDLVSRLTEDVGRVQDSLVAWTTDLLPQMATLAGMAVVLVAVDPPMALAGLAILPLLALGLAGRGRGRVAARLDGRSRQGEVAAAAGETLRGIRLVQAFASERLAQRAFERQNLGAVEAGLRIADLDARSGPVAEVALGLGGALILWIGVAGVLGGGLSVGALVVAIAYVASLFGPARSLTRVSSIIGRGAASRQRLAEILGAGESPSGPRGDGILAAPRRDIRFRSVSFAYHPGRPVLREVDLTIPAGSAFCIVGPSGAGKSTLLSLLLRLCDPDSGRIEADGVDLATLDPRSVRERIALVPQEPALFDGGLLQNIAAGRPGASAAEVRQAARMALVDDFAQALPEGYRSPVGEGGRLLSSGQRRRVAIARALVRGAAVMLLDEPTGELDPEAEARIMDAVIAGGGARTVVAVTSSVRLMARADRLAVLDGGRVVEQGTPAELEASGGYYARLRSLHQAAGRR